MTTKGLTMLHRQRGVLNLYWVAVASALLACVAMAALYSMRYERNLFAEGWDKALRLAGAGPAQEIVESARALAGEGAAKADGPMRRCVIDGKTVISNTDCAATNPTSKIIRIHDTKGFEAPKKPVQPDSAPTSDPALDKMIEKQLR